jgi:SlyX protein
VSDETRLVALESKLAFQEDAIRELSDALIAQQARLDQLEAWLHMVAEELDGDPSGGDEETPPEPPPPHY